MDEDDGDDIDVDVSKNVSMPKAAAVHANDTMDTHLLDTNDEEQDEPILGKQISTASTSFSTDDDFYQSDLSDDSDEGPTTIAGKAKSENNVQSDSKIDSDEDSETDNQSETNVNSELFILDVGIDLAENQHIGSHYKEKRYLEKYPSLNDTLSKLADSRRFLEINFNPDSYYDYNYDYSAKLGGDEECDLPLAKKLSKVKGMFIKKDNWQKAVSEGKPKYIINYQAQIERYGALHALIHYIKNNPEEIRDIFLKGDGEKQYYCMGIDMFYHHPDKKDKKNKFIISFR